MYLTKIIATNRDVVEHKMFSNYRWKQELCRAIPPKSVDKTNTREFLFKVADKNGYFEILVLSQKKPKPLSFGTWETKEMASNFYSRKRYVFDILANPAKKSRKSLGRVGIPLEEQDKWMEDQLKKMGCHVLSLDHRSFGMLPHKKPNGHPFRVETTQFLGTIEIVDQELFYKGVIQGIGDEKTFGYGLLLLKPIA